MLKLVVYDLGWGGELVADFLSGELQMVEVVRVISWQCRPSPSQPEELDALYSEATQALTEYLNQVDLIVFGGYTVAALFELFCQNFPGQKFVRLVIDCKKVLQTHPCPRQIAALMSSVDTTSELCLLLQQGLPESTLLLPDCAGWEQLIDDDSMTFEELYHTFAPDFVLCADAAKRRPLVKTLSRGSEPGDPPSPRNRYRPDTVLLLSSHFWAVKPELEQIFGYRVRIMDFRERLLHDVCRALKLRGVDGCSRY